MTSLSGLITALATPFTVDRPDLRAFADFVEWQIQEGSSALAPCGVTGEAPTLTSFEADQLIRTCVEVSSGRALVLVGVGFNCTRRSVEAAEAARVAGADAVLVATPAYNKPTEEGLYRHFEAIARAVDLPLVVHNAPARTRVDLHPETLRRLSGISSVVGIIDGSGDPMRPHAISLATDDRLVQLADGDAAPVAFNLAGGRGCLSVLANVAPRACAALQAACVTADWTLASALERTLRPLAQALDLETDPAPVKHALSRVRGGFSPALRLPLVQASAATARAVTEALDGLVAMNVAPIAGTADLSAGLRPASAAA
ncbi:4-hydroxy-tetrahydrodipicolinate synthase [uncultured Enterovirga sp.]|uniref:4-hydroxy-tetrahydrodipicolinate synthase n=1 Tax=uncultured Enterovirga sp. TaxID=2026352 RepID=UPI0035C9D565